MYKDKYLFDWMNETFLNSIEEVVGCLFLGRTTFSVCAYTIFLCYAIYDYQNEKPNEEKSPIDLLVKDLMHSLFCLLFKICLIGIISLFTLQSHLMALIWFLTFLFFCQISNKHLCLFYFIFNTFMYFITMNVQMLMLSS